MCGIHSLTSGLVVIALLICVESASVTPTSGQEQAAESTQPPKPLPDGTIGATVPSFFCHVVTGPLKNKSVCYVCRNGDRPVVMVILRRVSPEAGDLLRRIQQIVDQHRADGVRAFGVYVNDNTSRSVSRVQTFAFDGRVKLPLTICFRFATARTIRRFSYNTTVTAAS